VAWPFLGVDGGPLPETLDEGETIARRLEFMNAIPANLHTIEIVEINDATRTARTREHGGALKKWNHTLHVEPLTDTTCRYYDSVDLDAGRLTGLTYTVVNAFFAHRQRRWRKLAAQQSR
jgi:hypothetical protein